MTVPPEYQGWRTQIVFELPNLMLEDSGTIVYFLAVSRNATPVESDHALLRVEGVCVCVHVVCVRERKI